MLRLITAISVTGTREWVVPANAGIQKKIWVHCMKQFYVYIVCSKRNGTLYIGITSDLNRRIYEHKNGLIKGFTKKYSVTQLVYFEIFESATDAIRYVGWIPAFAGTTPRLLGLAV